MTADRLSHLDSHPEEAGRAELVLAAAVSLVVLALVIGLSVCALMGVAGWRAMP